MKTAPILPDTDILGAIQKAQNKLGLSPSDALAYVTRLLGTGIFLSEILEWIDSGTSSSKAVLDLVALGFTPKDAKTVIDGKRLGEDVSRNEFKQARVMSRKKRAKMVKATTFFAIFGEVFAREIAGVPLDAISNDEIERALIHWSNTAANWLAERVKKDFLVPPRKAQSDATQAMILNPKSLVKSCLEGHPHPTRHLWEKQVIGFIQAMKPATKKVIEAMV